MRASPPRAVVRTPDGAAQATLADGRTVRVYGGSISAAEPPVDPGAVGRLLGRHARRRLPTVPPARPLVRGARSAPTAGAELTEHFSAADGPYAAPSSRRSATSWSRSRTLLEPPRDARDLPPRSVGRQPAPGARRRPVRDRLGQLRAGGPEQELALVLWSSPRAIRDRSPRCTRPTRAAGPGRVSASRRLLEDDRADRPRRRDDHRHLARPGRTAPEDASARCRGSRSS